jgi:hypothetical protein
MIFRLTQKLAKKIGITPSRCLPLDKNPFADWSAHLFTAQRVQYVIMTNTKSLYSMVMYGRGITDDNQFVQRALSYMSEFMTDDGHEFLFQRFIVPRTGRISFSKMGDRRVLGSINDLVFQAKVHLVEGEVSPFDASLLLNETPMSCLGYSNPKEAFKSLRIEEGESNNGIESDEE